MNRETALRQDRRLVPILSQFSFALILGLVIAGPFIQMTGKVGEPYNLYRIAAYGFLGLLQTCLLLGRGLRQSLRIYATPVAGVLLWFCISLMWAEHFDLAGKRVILVVLLYLGIFSGVCDLGYSRALETLRLTLAIALVLNFATVICFADFATHAGPGQWRGFMAHKNIAGTICAATALFFVFDGKKIPSALRAAVIGGALFFLVKSWSRTALIALPISMVLGIAVARLRFRSEDDHLDQNKITLVTRVIFLVILVVLIILTLQRDVLTSFTEDASALSLRNSIWRPMVEFYLDHSILGSGYGSYWDAQISRENARSFSVQHWMSNVDQGHNGYLDLLVQTGIPGLSLALYAVIVWPMSQFAFMVRSQANRAALVFALLVFCMIENFTESSLFADDTLGNALIFFALALVHRYKMRQMAIRPSHAR